MGKYLSSIDLSKNELKQARIHNLATAPLSPVEGQIYHNTADHNSYIWNNTTWMNITASTITGAQMVTAINASTSIIEDDNLSALVNDAVTKRHTQNTDLGTTSATFYIGSGVKLKNNAGNLDVRNNADGAYANITSANISANGTMNVTGNATIGSGANTHIIKTLKTTISTSGLKLDGDASTRNVFEIVDGTGTPNKLFEVRQNGDTIIGGILTVNGTGTSTFAGDVNIAGSLVIAESATVIANMTGNNLTLTGNLIVEGNTTLGDNASIDVTTINGVTTIKSANLKSNLPTATNTVFHVVDSANSELFQVKQNGDAIIGGVLTVSGTGTSTFAGDVSIGGNLTVAGDSTATADLSGTDLTLTGNLVVNGNTTLGDNAAVDTVKLKARTTIYSPVTKALGSATTNVFEILDSATTGKLFEVRQNGDTVIGGILTVNGTGTSTFAGDVNIAGSLIVHDSSTVVADMTGNNLTLTGNLIVEGNTTLGDDASVDVTNIKGFASIKTAKVKASVNSTVDSAVATWKALPATIALNSGTGPSTVQTQVFKETIVGYEDVFNIIDSTGGIPNKLFQVKGNGDTIIAGVISVNGSGESTFAGDVNIGGNLTVAGDSTATADLSGTDLTLTGNLVVKGNTTLGDNVADTLVVMGVVTLPTTTTIGGVTQANIADAVTKKHAQNTDIGTSSSVFQVGTGGPKLKSSGAEMQVRNAADSAYADLRINNLYVEGTTTVINSNTVNIGDSEIELNSDVTTSAMNSDGGIRIKRLMADNVTRKDAVLNFNNSSGKWDTTSGPVTGVLVTAQIANKIVANLSTSATSYVITHNLNTRDITVCTRENSGSYEQVVPDVEFTTLDTITVRFAVAPTANQYTVTIVG